MTLPRRVWVALACTDPEHNGPEECFREVVDGVVHTTRAQAVAAAEATGLPFFEDMPDGKALAGEQWCMVDSYRVATAPRRKAKA